MPTPNTQTIQVITSLVNAAQQMMSLYDLIVTMDQQWTDQSVATLSAAMTTCAANADGTMGAVDATPKPANPISTTVYPTMPRSISSNQIAQMKTVVDGLVAYINGQAVTTQPGARAILNVAVGG